MNLKPAPRVRESAQYILSANLKTPILISNAGTFHRLPQARTSRSIRMRFHEITSCSSENRRHPGWPQNPLPHSRSSEVSDQPARRFGIVAERAGEGDAIDDPPIGRMDSRPRIELGEVRTVVVRREAPWRSGASGAARPYGNALVSDQFAAAEGLDCLASPAITGIARVGRVRRPTSRLSRAGASFVQLLPRQALEAGM